MTETTLPTPCSVHPEGHRFRWAGRAAVSDEVRCERPQLMNCECGEGFRSRCGASARAKCGPCSETYKGRVRRVARSGIVALPGRSYLLTLTAPGQRVHKIGKSGRVCPCTPPGGVDLGQWNGTMAQRWNHFITDVRRYIGEVEYFAAKEVQARGALHIHAPMRFSAPVRVSIARLRLLAIRHGFGHEVDFVEITDEGRAAGYVAKYVSKSAGERERAPFVHRETGEIGPGKWRTWTSSRTWGSSMASVRAAQRAWWSSAGASVVGGAGGPQGEPGGRPEAPRPGDAEGGALDTNTENYAGRRELPTSLVLLPV